MGALSISHTLNKALYKSGSLQDRIRNCVWSGGGVVMAIISENKAKVRLDWAKALVLPGQ